MVSIYARRISHYVALVCLLGVAACGGGGGSGGGSGNGSTGLGLSLSTNSIEFVANHDAAPAPPTQLVTASVNGSGSGTLYVLVETSSSPILATVDNILVDPLSSSGSAIITPVSPASLGIGVFTGTITVKACLNDPSCATGQIAGSPQVVSVTYTVPGALVSPTAVDFAVGNSSPPQPVSEQITVTGIPASTTWSADANVPWVSVFPASGNTNTPTQVAVTLQQSSVDTLANGTYSGLVTITPTPGSGRPVQVPVTLVISRTQVTAVAPYIAISGTTKEVIVRGENFDQVTITGVSFGGTSVAAVNVVSPTEIRVNHPVLSAGTYEVQLQSAEGFNSSLAKLVVVDQQSYGATTLSHPVAPNPLAPFGFVYDAERRALLVTRRNEGGGGSALSTLTRYQYNGSQWSAPTTTVVPGITSLTLSIDGSELLAGTEAAFDDQGGHFNAGIRPVRASDLLVGTAIETSISPSSGIYMQSWAVGNDGVAFVTTSGGGSVGSLLRFQTRDRSFSSSGIAATFAGAAASTDGSRVLFGSANLGEVYDYSASLGTAAATPINFPAGIRSVPSLSRTGSRFILNDGRALIGRALVRVFDGATMLGDLPTSTVAAVISPDGLRAYSLDISGKLRTFDLSSPAPFPELGAAGGVVLAGSPGTPTLEAGFGIKMLISPDGGTIFLAGGDQIVVQPVP